MTCKATLIRTFNQSTTHSSREDVTSPLNKSSDGSRFIESQPESLHLLASRTSYGGIHLITYEYEDVSLYQAVGQCRLGSKLTVSPRRRRDQETKEIGRGKTIPLCWIVIKNSRMRRFPLQALKVDSEFVVSHGPRFKKLSWHTLIICTESLTMRLRIFWKDPQMFPVRRLYTATFFV